PDGASTLVTYGILNLTHRQSHEQPEPLEPGNRYRVRLQLCDAAHSFAPGHRMRLALSTAYWKMVWPSPQRARLKVHLGGCRFELPVRPPAASDASLRPFGEPECAPPYPDEPTLGYRRDHAVSEDPASGMTAITVHRARGHHLPEIGLTNEA